MEPKFKISVTDIISDGTVSILTQTYIVYNGQEVILNNYYEALAPGQFDRTKEILPENLYNAVKSIWTDDVVKSWEEKLNNILQNEA